MIENLERNYYNRHLVKQELFSVFRGTINTLKYEYYYEECNIQLHLCGYSLGPADNPDAGSQMEAFEFISLSIDGAEKSISDDVIITKSETTDQL